VTVSVHAPTKTLPAAAARRGRRAGIAGNERLTAWTAVVLLVLLAVEGVTIVFLGPLLPVHLFVGVLLIGPVALKLASTGWRFARYYLGAPAYRQKGPPHPLLRGLAPLVVVSTVAVLGTGVWLLLAGPQVRDTVVPLHKASFIVWVVVTAVHVLGHLLDLPGGLRRERTRPGRGARGLTLAGALAAGIVLAALAVPYFSAWSGVGGG
jgi:hypothetical protein